VLEIGLMQSGLLKKFAVIALYNTVTAWGRSSSRLLTRSNVLSNMR
jgi:hypothetical protein